MAEQKKKTTKKKVAKKTAKKNTRKRARKDDGQFKADDPSTPENEAWETGEDVPEKILKKNAVKYEGTDPYQLVYQSPGMTVTAFQTKHGVTKLTRFYDSAVETFIPGATLSRKSPKSNLYIIT